MPPIAAMRSFQGQRKGFRRARARRRVESTKIEAPAAKTDPIGALSASLSMQAPQPPARGCGVAAATSLGARGGGFAAIAATAGAGNALSALSFEALPSSATQALTRAISLGLSWRSPVGGM
jgi:hypothetical protein